MQILWDLKKWYFEFPSIQEDSDQLQAPSLVVILHSIWSVFSKKYNDLNGHDQKDNF